MALGVESIAKHGYVYKNLGTKESGVSMFPSETEHLMSFGLELCKMSRHNVRQWMHFSTAEIQRGREISLKDASLTVSCGFEEIIKFGVRVTCVVTSSEC